MKIKKFEAFKPSDIRTNGVYLKSYLDGKEEKRPVIVRDYQLDEEQTRELAIFQLKLKRMDWQELSCPKPTNMFAYFDLKFTLPPNLSDELKAISPRLHRELTEKMVVGVEAANFHRTHIEGLPGIFQGLGLGSKLYKATIKQIGYISTDRDSSSSAKHLWSRLIQDSDFYALLTDHGALLIDKRLSQDENQLAELILNFLQSSYVYTLPGQIDKKTRDDFYLRRSYVKADPELAQILKHLKLSRLDVDVFQRYDQMKKYGLNNN